MNENSENLKELFDGMYKLKSKLIQPRFDAEVAYTTKKRSNEFPICNSKSD